MFKATRELIKLRQPHSNAIIEKVYVNRIDGGERNRCFDNASRIYDQNKRLKIVSGWFVNAWNKTSNSCLILAHYWNVDEQGIFFDSSPMDDLSGEYVVDSEIGIFASQNFDSLKSDVWSSLIFNNSNILGVDFREQGKEHRKMENFDTKSLFAELN